MCTIQCVTSTVSSSSFPENEERRIYFYDSTAVVFNVVNNSCGI